MKLQHTDPNRQAPKYCESICVLCGAAARMQLASKFHTDLSATSQRIREMRTPEFVIYADQEPVVQAFLLLAGMPVITPATTTTPTGQPLPTAAVPSTGGEEPGT